MGLEDGQQILKHVVKVRKNERDFLLLLFFFNEIATWEPIGVVLLRISHEHSMPLILPYITFQPGTIA